jgi:hypothetical protein
LNIGPSDNFLKVQAVAANGHVSTSHIDTTYLETDDLIMSMIDSMVDDALNTECLFIFF